MCINDSSKAKSFYTKYGIHFSNGEFVAGSNATATERQNVSEVNKAYSKARSQYDESRYSTTDKNVRAYVQFLEDMDAGMTIYEYYPDDYGTPIYNHVIVVNTFQTLFKSW